jgi:four helix bundle protein
MAARFGGMNHDRRRDYRDLVLWQKAMGLASEVHRVTLKLPRHEMFGLTAQIRRAAVSIPSNIAEGAGRRTTRDFLAFLHVARGSLSELETQLFLAQSIGYLSEADWAVARTGTIEVGRLLNAVITGLRRRQETAV